MSQEGDRFDARYYRRFYLNPRTRAGTPQGAAKQAAFIHAYLRYLEIPVKRVLDIGCGLGRHLRPIEKLYPRARCIGVEYSPYLCDRYGWERGSVTDYVASQPFDLVLCSDVLPSLDDRACDLAIRNLAKLTRGALFLGVLTKEDLREADHARTDLDVYTRNARWYRTRLARHFTAVGGGIFLKKPVEVAVWAMEKT
jgi:trans-aconitate methyltransferase